MTALREPADAFTVADAAKASTSPRTASPTADVAEFVDREGVVAAVIPTRGLSEEVSDLSKVLGGHTF